MLDRERATFYRSRSLTFCAMVERGAGAGRGGIWRHSRPWQWERGSVARSLAFDLNWLGVCTSWRAVVRVLCFGSLRFSTKLRDKHWKLHYRRRVFEEFNYIRDFTLYFFNLKFINIICMCRQFDLKNDSFRLLQRVS